MTKRVMTWRLIICLGITLMVLGVLVPFTYGILVEPYQVEIRHLWIEDPKLARVLKGMTLIHISDLHMSKIGRREQKVLKILDAIKPDLIFLTGDYITWKGNYEVALDFLSRLKAKVGVWAVMGDYDYSCSEKSCLFCHVPGTGKPTRRHSVRFLRNSFEQINLTNRSILIGGIDLEEGQLSSTEKRLFPLSRKVPAIILSHDPLGFDLLDEDKSVLMLSGDTHGGQIFLPSWLWKILGYEKCARYPQGLFVKGQKKMFVSRGIGTSHLPIRIFSRPEVVVLHFKP